jgi:hypothetical protein
MKKWIERALACLMAFMMAFTVIPALPAEAEPEDPWGKKTGTETLEAYVKERTFLAGTSSIMRIWKDPESTKMDEYVTEMEMLAKDAILGYRIADYDQDGADELLIVGLFGDKYAVQLQMYEVEGSYVVLKDSYLLSEDQYFTPLMPLMAGDGQYAALVDVFYFVNTDNGGKIQICVESEVGNFVLADGRAINLVALSYQGNAFHVNENAGYAGSSGFEDTGFTNRLKNLGFKEINWDNLFAQFSTLGHYAPNYQSVARITHMPIVTYQEAVQFLQYGSHIMPWSRVDFSMPWARKKPEIIGNQMLPMLFAGFNSKEDVDYFTTPVSNWHEGMIMSLIYNLLSLDITNAVSSYSDASMLVDLSYNDYKYAKVPSKGENWYKLWQGQFALLYKSLVGFCPDMFFDKPFTYGDVMYGDGTYVYIFPGDGPDLQLLPDTIYEENDHTFVTGYAYQFQSEEITCLGRFTAELQFTAMSIFGYYFKSLYFSGEPVYVSGLTAKASSFIPPEGDISYGPELVLDWDTTTAWNEDVPGDGIGEWIELTTSDYQYYYIYGIQILSGYHKSPEVYAQNGKPTLLTVQIGNFAFDREVQYDDVIAFKEPLLARRLKFTIKDAISGSEWDDTCITEIKLLTGPIPGMPPYGTGSTISGSATPEGYYAIVLPEDLEEKEEEEDLPQYGPKVNPDAEYYILPESNTRLYSTAELSILTASELRIARNEIYARHGRRFASADLQAYFDSKPWYSGTIAPEAFDNGVLNDIERENVKRIEALE